MPNFLICKEIIRHTHTFLHFRGYFGVTIQKYFVKKLFETRMKDDNKKEKAKDGRKKGKSCSKIPKGKKKMYLEMHRKCEGVCLSNQES